MCVVGPGQCIGREDAGMLSWKVCWHRDPCPGDCECVRHRKRRPRRDIMGIILIAAAVVVLLCCLPLWIFAVMAFAVLLGLGVIWLCT